MEQEEGLVDQVYNKDIIILPAVGLEVATAEIGNN